MRSILAAILSGIMLALAADAEVAPVAVRMAVPKAWIGQRVSMYVELRAPGSFVGTAGFELPPIPGTLLVKIGNPVVSSQDIEGASWFVQTHEFALFSQKAGVLEIPPFAVSFSRRQGYVGAAAEVKAKTSPVSIEIQRPPDSERIGFLVTTESLDVTETWDPPPGPAQVGSIFKRTIVQRSQDLPGMALAPAPTAAPDGIKVYPGNAQTKDDLERGNFLGERRETITYLLQKPGPLTLPALTYVWWNPKSEKLQSKTLPAVTFEVAAPPVASAPAASGATLRVRTWLLVAALVAVLSICQGRRIAGWATFCWKRLNPPRRVAARQLLHACRRGDPALAMKAWNAWRDMQAAGFQPGPDLRAAILALQRQLFGPKSAALWHGDDLARAFKNPAAAKTPFSHRPESALPELNPQN